MANDMRNIKSDISKQSDFFLEVQCYASVILKCQEFSNTVDMFVRPSENMMI